MCQACWAGYGHPTELPEHGQEAINLIRELYQDHPTGGPLHVQLDDWNIGGPWEAWNGNDIYTAETMDLCRRIGELMSSWTEVQQAAVLAAFYGYEVPDE